MAIGISRTGNARNNYLYGTQDDDTLDGGAGDDYLRGYQGDDSLWGGTGADRFVFERTWTQNGTDTIMDYSFSEGDILDFSLVGFARGVFNKALLATDVIRIKQGPGNTARVLIDVDGGGDFFQEWAVLHNIALGADISMRVGATVIPAVVAKYPPVVKSFVVSGTNQLSVTADEAVTALLYAWTGGAVGAALGFASTPDPLVANVPGTFTLAAQGSVTEAVLRITDGVDTVAPTPDTHVFLGTDGNDQGGTAITGSANADMIFGFGGNDLIMAGAGADTVYGGTGNDTIDGDGGADVIDGEAGNDVMRFGSAADLAGTATVIGGADVDTITLLPGGVALALVSANFAKATGFEALDLQGDSTLSVTLGTETNAAFASGITITSRATATSLNLQGALSAVGINATGTNNGDTLVGGTVADSLAGGTGNDTITGGAGADNLSGGDGDDEFRFADRAEIVADTAIDGGNDTDKIVIAAQVTTALNLGTQANIIDVELLTLTGGSTADVTLDAQMTGVTLGAAGRVVQSAVGQIVTGSAGIDTVTAITGVTSTSDLNAGANVVVVTNGANISSGTFNATGGTVGYNVDAAATGTLNVAQAALISSAVGVQNLTLSDQAVALALNAGVETFTLAAGANSVVSLAHGQTINADALADAQVLTLGGNFDVAVSLVAGDLAAGLYSGDLTVTATTGSNVIVTGGGNDIITGGAGADVLTGGNGADTFVIAFGGEGGDTITDFIVGVDVIDFSGASDVNTFIVGNAARFLLDTLNDGTGLVVGDDQILDNGFTAIIGLTSATATAADVVAALNNGGDGFILRNNTDIVYVALNVTDVDLVAAGDQSGAVIARVDGQANTVIPTVANTTVVATLVGVDVAGLTADNFADFG